MAVRYGPDGGCCNIIAQGDPGDKHLGYACVCGRIQHDRILYNESICTIQHTVDPVAEVRLCPAVHILAGRIFSIGRIHRKHVFCFKVQPGCFRSLGVYDVRFRNNDRDRTTGEFDYAAVSREEDASGPAVQCMSGRHQLGWKEAVKAHRFRCGHDPIRAGADEDD